MPWGIPSTSHEKPLKYPHRNAAFWNGLRMVLSMLIPATIGFYLGYPRYALIMTLGTLVVGISDIPGTTAHRRNGMLIGLFVILIAHTATVASQLVPYMLGPVIMVLSFLLSYMSLYGVRAATIGASGMLAMVFALHSGDQWIDIIMSPLMMAIGGGFYILVSMTFMIIRPYRIVRQSLGDSILNIADYIKERSELYRPGSDIKKTYKNLLEHQIRIVEEQENVRELLLKSREAQKGSSHLGRALVMIFSESVDILEIGLSSHFKYSQIHKNVSNEQLLYSFRIMILEISYELRKIGISISYGTQYKKLNNLRDTFNKLKEELESYENMQSAKPENSQIDILKNILNQLDRLITKTEYIIKYASREFTPKASSLREMQLHLFTQHQSFEVRPFFSNLSWQSNYFKHAVRLSVCMGLGMLIGNLIPHQNSYWILLTVAIILKPNYSITRKKTGQRLIGTVIGGIAGFLILSIPGINILWIAPLLALSAWGSFTFNALNYRTSVVFTTLAVLFGNYFIQPDFISLIQFRIFDTFIGAVISIGALYIIWPQWESRALKSRLIEVLTHNIDYLISLKFLKSEGGVVNYKVYRKKAMVSNANLQTSIVRMLKDPAKMRYKPTTIYQLSILNYALMSHIAAIGSSIRDNTEFELRDEHLEIISSIEKHLRNAISFIGPDAQSTQDLEGVNDEEKFEVENATIISSLSDTTVLQKKDTKISPMVNQLEYLLDLSKRILKHSEKIRDLED